MALLTRDDILHAQDRQYDTVACPEWGGEVRLRSITGTQRDAYEDSIRGKGKAGERELNLRNARVKLIVMCAVDEHDQLMFTTEDINAFGRKNAKPIDHLFDACRELAGLGEGDVERAVENFDDDPNEPDTTD